MKAKGTSKAATQQTTAKRRELQVKLPEGTTQDQAMADLVAEGQVTNATTALNFLHPQQGDLSLTDLVNSLHKQADSMNKGDLSSLVGMLNSQAVTLNAMFAELSRRALLNVGTHLNATEVYLRLALKAQAQTRSTAEAIAAIKNPPMMFARQANINNGGQQQVNNAPVSNGSHAEKTEHSPNELGVNTAHGSSQMDRGTTPAAGRSNPVLETVGALNGSKNQ